MQRSSRVQSAAAALLFLLLALTVFASQASWSLAGDSRAREYQNSSESIDQTAGHHRQSAPPKSPAPENFDIRADLNRALALRPENSRGRYATSRANEASRLLRSNPDAVIRWNSLTGMPSRVYSSYAPLSAQTDDDAWTVARRFLRDNADLYRLSDDEIVELRFQRLHQTRHNGLTHLTLEQQFKGIDIFQARLTVHIDRAGAVVATTGELYPDAAHSRNATHPAIGADLALARAASYAGLEKVSSSPATAAADTPDQQQNFSRAPDFARDIPARLVYFPLSADQLRLAWEFELWLNDRPDAYLIIVDAERGTLLYRHNLTCYEENPLRPRGLVFTGESPRPNNPHRSSSPAVIARIPEPFNGAAIFAISDQHYDWWAGRIASSLVGNNTSAQLDRDANNLPDLPLVTAADGNFSFPLDLTGQPWTQDNQKAAQVNLFYWINRFHDLLYAFGFTESAGNFQQNNFGLGGAAGDAIEADAQDGSGTNNASFSTPPDGRPGRVQMFLWSGSPQLDGDLDRTVIFHELAHGVSNRLIGNGTGLSGFQARGLGEGWSDYFALALLRDEGDPLDGAYAVGQYVRSDYDRGIRRYPYSTRREVYPYTFTHLALSPSVHAAGEIWCVTLWDLRARLIRQHGFTEGQRQSIQLVVDGMKLTPPDPTFLEARDAILLADRVNNGGANQCLLWEAFAARGLGYMASTSGTADQAPVESFTLPPWCVATASLELDKRNYVPGELVHITAGDSNAHTPVVVQVRSSVTNDVVSLTLRPDQLIPGSYAGSLRTAAGRAVGSDEMLQVSVDAGDEIVVTLADQKSANGSESVITARAGVVRETTVFADACETGNQGWIATGAWALTRSRAASPQYAWTDSPSGNYTDNSDTALISPPLDLRHLSDVSLTFSHSFDLENRYDFALVEYSTDEGETWTRVAAFTGRQAEFRMTSVRLDALSGQQLARIRFRLLSDQARSADGWYIDDVLVTARSSDPLVIRPASPPVPEISAISPAWGPPDGGSRITISGKNFTSTHDSQLTFDGLPAADFAVISPTLITAVTPPHMPGAVTVRVTNRHGSAALAAGFLYYDQAAPSAPLILKGLFPASGSLRGGTLVTITGDHFTPDTVVIFGAQSAAATFINRKTLAAIAPSAAVAATVPVTLSDRGSAATLSNGFRYTEPSPPTGRLLTPEGGERIYSGSTISIQWQSADNGSIRRHRLQLVRGTSAQPQLLAELSGDLPGDARAFNWRVPVDIGTIAQARLRLLIEDDEGIETAILSDGDFSIERRWEAVSPLPFPLEQLSATSDGRFIYALSGRRTWASNTTVETVSRFDPSTGTWTSLGIAPLPLGLSGGEAVFLDGRIYIPGGFTASSGTPTSQHYVYDTAANAWTLLAPTPAVTSNYALAADDTRGIFYQTGGNNVLGNSVALCRSYNAKSRAWTILPSMLTARSGHEAALIDDRLYVAGGSGVAGGLTSCERFDLSDNRWVAIAGLHRPRRYATSAVGRDSLGNRLWLITGGEDPATGRPIHTVEAYDPRADRWIELDDSFTQLRPRSLAAATVLDGRIYTIGGSALQGSFPALTTQATVERMQIDSLTLRPGSTPPVLAVPEAQIAIAGCEISFTVKATDLHSRGPLEITADGLPPGAQFTTRSLTANSATGEFRWTPSAEDGGKSLLLIFKANDGTLSDARSVKISVVAAAPLAVASAANYAGGVIAPDAIVAAFGADLAVRTEAAQTLPLPFELAGTRVTVNGVAAPLFFVSPHQVNFAVPPGVDIGYEGTAKIIVSNPGGSYALGIATLSATQPGLFTSDATGTGAAAALATSDGIRYESAPFAVHDDGRPNVLVLYGTGIRNTPAENAGDENGVAESVSVTIGGEPAQVLYAGAQPSFVGLDQINVLLPAKPAGLADGLPRQLDIIVSVSQIAANRVYVTIR